MQELNQLENKFHQTFRDGGIYECTFNKIKEVKKLTKKLEASAKNGKVEYLVHGIRYGKNGNKKKVINILVGFKILNQGFVEFFEEQKKEHSFSYYDINLEAMHSAFNHLKNLFQDLKQIIDKRVLDLQNFYKCCLDFEKKALYFGRETINFYLGKKQITFFGYNRSLEARINKLYKEIKSEVYLQLIESKITKIPNLEIGVVFTVFEDPLLNGEFGIKKISNKGNERYKSSFFGFSSANKEASHLYKHYEFSKTFKFKKDAVAYCIEKVKEIFLEKKHDE